MLFSIKYMWKIEYSLLFLLYMQQILLLHVKASRYQLTWTSIKCSHNKKYVRSFDCAIQEPDRKFFNMDVNYLRDMSQGYKVNVRMDIINPKDAKLLNVMDLELDVCKFLSGQRNNNFVEIARKGFAEYGNFTSKCPLRKDVTYGLHNFTFDISMLPYLPESELKITQHYKMPINNEVATMEIRCKLEPTKKRQIIPA